MSGAWPAFNASLNAASALLLTLGFVSIRRRRPHEHAALMLTACAVSLAFLVSYLAYHARAGSVRFAGAGWIRPVYFAVLLSHTVLAVAIVPLVARALVLAFQRRLDAHRALARWTLPLWLYVNVTGVVVYWMLYQL